METYIQPKIFLSYAWANKDVADEIDGYFEQVSITFQRDIRDIDYAGNIKDFMNLIGKSDFVVMLISDEYIKSENCMYEVTELLESHEFEKRILPVVVNNASVFNGKTQEQYYDYWQEKVDEARNRLNKHQNEKTLADKKKMENIYSHLGNFFQKLTDLKLITYTKLKRENYKPILKKIGLETGAIIARLLEIEKIEDGEERELAFEKIEKKNPDNVYVMFQKAFYANKNRQHKKAKKYYEELVSRYPKYADAHYNLAILLEKEFQLYAEAKYHFEQAIAAAPGNAKAYNYLGYILAERFREYDAAKIILEKALEIDPQYARTHYNLAKLCYNLSLFDDAKNHYEKAIAIDPFYADAHYNLANLLRGPHFNAYDEARKHYEEVIKINPTLIYAYNNFALLLVKYYKEYNKAREYYERDIELNPNNEITYLNLAILLISEFKEDEIARQYLEKALKINSQSENAKAVLEILQELENHKDMVL